VDGVIVPRGRCCGVDVVMHRVDVVVVQLIVQTDNEQQIETFHKQSCEQAQKRNKTTTNKQTAEPETRA
jgi:hypothetical protein